MHQVLATIVSTLLFVNTAFAAVDCAGDVTNLSLQLNSLGTVTLSLSGGPAFVYLCDVDATRNGVSPMVCRTMYATLMAAKTSAKKVSIRFYNYDTCAAIPPYTDAGTLGWTVLLTD